MIFIKANNLELKLPTFDPVVAEYIAKPSSNVPTLLAEINDHEIYATLFNGKKDLTFLDIGANIGLVSIFASAFCRRIVAVEPDPRTFQVLKAVTNGFPVIECFNAALAPKDGACQFFQNDENTTASSSVNTFGTKIEVPGLTLSSILRINQLERVDVCKIDAEGSEELSLNAFELLTAAPIIDCFYIETHNTPSGRWSEIQARLCQTLKYLNYKKQHVHGMRVMAWK